jgi:hypothetical protein
VQHRQHPVVLAGDCVRRDVGVLERLADLHQLVPGLRLLEAVLLEDRLVVVDDQRLAGERDAVQAAVALAPGAVEHVLGDEGGVEALLLEVDQTVGLAHGLQPAVGPELGDVRAALRAQAGGEDGVVLRGEVGLELHRDAVVRLFVDVEDLLVLIDILCPPRPHGDRGAVAITSVRAVVGG